jgi:hypothetical protein
VRTLFEEGTGFRGVSVGYDSLWQQGEYYQQLGAALEYTKQDYQLVLTMGLPLSAAGATPAGATPLASVNVQVSLPTGYPGLAVQPRVYVGLPEKVGPSPIRQRHELEWPGAL